jgi:hypothetical protein
MKNYTNKLEEVILNNIPEAVVDTTQVIETTTTIVEDNPAQAEEPKKATPSEIKPEDKRKQIEHARDALYMARDIIKELNKKNT